MQPSEMEMLLTALGATAEIMGTQLEPRPLMIMAEDLSDYALADVLNALKRCRREVKGRLTLADIMERIDSSDGFPGAEEAWSLMSRPEDDTVVITEEMAEAMQYARPLLNEGDKIAARMAFKDAYLRIIRESRDNHRKPRWFVSLGHEKQSRAQPIADAIRNGKLTLDHSIRLLSPEAKAEVLQLTGNTNHPFLLEFKQAQLEESKPLDKQTGLRRIAEIKMAMRKSA